MEQGDSHDGPPSSAPRHRERPARFAIAKIARHVTVAAASLVASISLSMGWTAFRKSAPSADAYVVATLAQRATSAPTAFDAEQVSSDTRALTVWIAASANNAGLAYLVVDKRAGVVYVFAPDNSFMASSAVLLGAASGDTTVPDIGDRSVAQVMPHERITPAGRFVGERGRNTRGEDVVWLDYAAGISIHRVLTSNVAENRLSRLATADTKDNRISYGCINVPDAFFNRFIEPVFAKNRALIYVLPEVKTAQQVFGL